MRQSTLSVVLACGILLGVGLTLRVRAEDKPKPDWSRLQVITYASGLTGFFDPATGKLYVYDSSWNNCVFIRQLTELGEPMKMIKNP